VIDRDAYLLLQDVIRREGRSFLQYAGESFPWSTAEDRETVAKVRALISEEREATAALSRYLARNRLTPPYLGAYPSYFTSYNYMSVDRLVPLLVDHQRNGVAALEADLKALKDGDSRKQVQQVVELKKRHLDALEALAGMKAPVTSDGRT
jgi:hypothetical protein